MKGYRIYSAWHVSDASSRNSLMVVTWSSYSRFTAHFS